MTDKWGELKRDIATIRDQITERQTGPPIVGAEDDPYLHGAATAYASVAEWMRLLEIKTGEIHD